MRFVDDFLNNITMYRLVLYFLIILVVVGFGYSVFGVLPFDPINYLFSVTFILAVSYITNFVFAKVFEAPVNVESFWISGLILGLIIKPATDLHEIIFLGWAAVLTMGLKFILAINKKHIFNPVAIATTVTAFAINGSPNWWVGNIAMLPIVALGGLLIVRKIRRWDLVLSFLVTALIVIGPTRWQRSIMDTPLIFFAVIMITEPLTSPPTKILRIIYGAIVGFLFAPQIHLGSVFTTPELALVVGNIFVYIVSPKYKLLLKLKQKIQLTPDTYDFIFALDSPIKFTAGQYMEFTLDHKIPDMRGNRRYLSLANSPTENEIRLGIKFGSPPSTYKQKLLSMEPNDVIAAGQLVGDFILPKEVNKKIVLIAGGIGITPFRSMIKYLIDRNEKRDIVVIYTVTNKEDFVYKDVLKEAEDKLGIKTVYVETSTMGRTNSNMLAKEVPDYLERTFYVSGNHHVVKAFEEILKHLNISKNKIITDYFPGFT